MHDLLERANGQLRAAEPALFAALSPLGRRALYPPDIPFQAAQAKNKTFNGTIGQITDGKGGAVPLATMSAALSGLSPGERHRALLYSPIEGFADVRKLWQSWQRRGVADDVPATLPLVVDGLTHGLALAAELFAGEGRVVAVPTPYWGNYDQIFGLRLGARVVAAPAYHDGQYDPRAIARALDGAGLAPGESAVAILNVPSNPGGYSPTAAERADLVASLLAVAAERPFVVICDDAYSGLVFEPDIPRLSPFWDLAGRHRNLIALKVDGTTKELSYFGGRVGFLTFGVAADSPAVEVLESKVKCLVRAGVGSPVSTGQVLAVQALTAPDLDAQVAVVHELLGRRFRALAAAFRALDRDLLRPLPMNSGCFGLAELGPKARERGVTAEAIRQHLLEHEDTGVVAIGDDFVRVAFCSVDEAALPELVARLERGVAALAGQASPVRG
jgi:aspartate/methionine/tyrosine aminotransferase